LQWLDAALARCGCEHGSKCHKPLQAAPVSGIANYSLAMARVVDSDADWMRRAISIAEMCAPAPSAYCVGAMLVPAPIAGVERSPVTGYSRERPGNTHAEEVALAKASEHGWTSVDLAAATLFTTMEPCGLRLSGKTSCADRVLACGVRRVVIAIAEPPYFVAKCDGAARLAAAGVEVRWVEEAEIKRRALEVATRGLAS